MFVSEERNSYEITTYNPDGTLSHTITRPYKSWKRTAEEKKIAEDAIMPYRRRNRNRMNIVVAATEKDITRMRVADDGRLWVLSSRGLREQPAGIHSTWDVFDQTGHFEKTVAIACEGVGVRDRIFFASDNIIVLVKQYADALKSYWGLGGDEEVDETEELEGRPLEVICYRIVSD